MQLASKNKSYVRLAFIIMVIAVAGWAIIPAAYGNQTHMEQCLSHLRSARIQLDRAKPGKGGHREKARVLIDQAMAEVEAGIIYDRTH